MLLSVIVPVYNAERTLQRCLDSLLTQGIAEDDLEIVCVDDGSSDGSLSILHREAASHPCIKVFSQKNQGASAARNVGLNHASGDVITFCDADDYLIPNGLGYVLDTFWNEKIDVLCHASTTLSIAKLRTWQEENEVRGEVIYEGSGREVYERDTKYFVWNTLISRSFLERIRLRFLPMTMSEDSVFMLELMMQAEHSVDVSSNIYRYTVSGQQVTSRRDAELMRKCLADYLAFMERLQHYEQNQVIDALKQPFYSRALSADLTQTEYVSMRQSVARFGIKACPYWMYQPMSWLYRTLFVPYVLPHISRG